MATGKLDRRHFLAAVGSVAGVGIAASSGLTAPARAAAGDRAYLGCYSSDGASGHGIAIATADSAGRLTVDGMIDVTDPSFLALSPDGSRLYAVNEGSGPGMVTAVDPHTAQVLNSVAVRGNGPTHLCVAPDGRAVLTANYGSGSVSVVSVTEDGRLGAVTDVARHTGSGPDPERQEGPHAHQVLFDPSGHWVLVVDLGVDAVYVYQLADGGLKEHARVAMAPGSGPRHLRFHPDGQRAYVANELNSTVTVCRWRADTGELVAGQSVAADTRGGDPRNYPSEPVVSPDGRLLYLANRGHDNIATFAVMSDSLVPLTTTPCGGVFPRDLTLDPSGRRLYASNQKSNSVTWLGLDPITGIPQGVAGSLETGSPTTVLFA
ncbi:lactonase family protein [Nocardia pseudobrasiliensis]|uniref:6-phosphogluconolactonase (Cycloisomerase 2 family) n=1 Tax=Nocardia pseudobrasiliensis TaxID=45979 RepID=A0A370I253_9NOCA|nr:lactonase family protein [Nocardia pseudobrasiliensis]RDI64251.1 6-phosphogluconolactonase (cycloisomerase 2 family) [Nocardia pseudobrasiliensis]